MAPGADTARAGSGPGDHPVACPYSRPLDRSHAGGARKLAGKALDLGGVAGGSHGSGNLCSGEDIITWNPYQHLP